MRKLCIVLCLVLTLGVFSSCKAPADNKQEMPDIQEQLRQPEESSGVSEEPSTVPAPEVSKEPERNILDNKTPCESSTVLYNVFNEHVSGGISQKIFSYGENILVSGPVAGSDEGPAVKLYILSSETGEALASRVFDGMDLAEVQVCGDKIALADWSDGEFVLLDSALEPVKTFTTGTEYCGFYADPKAETLYVFTNDEGIRVIPLDGGAETRLLENASGLYASKVNDYGVSFTYTDRVTQLAMSGFLSFEKNEAINVPFEGTFTASYMVGDIWLAPVFGESGVYCIGRAERPARLELEKQEKTYKTATLLCENSRILVTTYAVDECVLSLYESDGRFISSCSLGEGTSGVTGELLWSEKDSGYFFTVISPEGKDLLLFWDISLSTAGSDLEFSSFETDEPRGSAVDAALYDRAASVGERFDVSILIADTCDTALDEYEMEQECSADLIAAALDAVERALGAYPEGFIKQLKFDVARNIELQLCGTIKKKELPENVSGFSNFSGFMTRRDSRSVIVLDISGLASLEQLIHHELAHVIHGKLVHDAALREDALYSEDAWLALQPEGFVYADTYDEMPMEYFTDGYEAWFIDLYSRTFAKEDIARVLEYAASGQAWAFSSSEYKAAKLEYLCLCIRDAFDDTLWPEDNLFEQTLKMAKQ